MVPNNIKKCSSENKFKTVLNHGSRMSILEDFAKNIDQVGFIWFTSTFCNISEGKRSLYIFCIFWFLYTFCIYSLLRGSFAWFPSVSFFSTSLQIFLEIRRHSAFSWGFPCWGIGWNAVVATIFCILLVYLVILLFFDWH